LPSDLSIISPWIAAQPTINCLKCIPSTTLRLGGSGDYGTVRDVEAQLRAFVTPYADKLKSKYPDILGAVESADRRRPNHPRPLTPFPEHTHDPLGIAGIGFMGMTHYNAYQKIRGVKVSASASRTRSGCGDWRTIKGNFGPQDR